MSCSAGCPFPVREGCNVTPILNRLNCTTCIFLKLEDFCFESAFSNPLAALPFCLSSDVHLCPPPLTPISPRGSCLGSSLSFLVLEDEGELLFTSGLVACRH